MAAVRSRPASTPTSRSGVRRTSASSGVVAWRSAEGALKEGPLRSAVDDDRLSADVGRARRGEKADDVPELARLAPAAKRDVGEHLGGRSFWVEVGQPIGGDAPGCDAVDRDATRSKLARERLQPAADGRPEGVGEREMLGGLLRGDGRDREDAPGRALLQLRQAKVHEANERLEHQLERLLERVWRHVRAAARRRATGVPDEDVQAAERLERLRDGALEIARERHVAADGERADPVRLALEHVAPAGE